MQWKEETKTWQRENQDYGGGGGKEVRGLIKSFKEQATNISLGLGHMVRADCLV